MKRIIIISSVLLVLCIPFDKSVGQSENLIPVTFLYTIDGDTIKVLYEGKQESVRLIGIDAFETRRNRRAYKQAKLTGFSVKYIVKMGKRVKSFVNYVLMKNNYNIRIEFDKRKRDRYNRLLAYVYLHDRFLNGLLLAEGHVLALFIAPNIKYQGKLVSALRYAVDNNKGIWSKLKEKNKNLYKEDKDG